MSTDKTNNYAEGDVETAVGATVIALMVIFVALRFYARVHLKTGIGWDDWLALIGLVAAIVAALLVLSSKSLVKYSCIATIGIYELVLIHTQHPLWILIPRG